MPNTLGVAGSRIGYRSTGLNPLLGQWRMAREVPAGSRREDHVELTKVAGEDNCGPNAPEVDGELVERIRRSIAAGEYLTVEKIDVTVDCLYRELLGH